MAPASVIGCLTPSLASTVRVNCNCWVSAMPRDSRSPDALRWRNESGSTCSFRK